MTGDIVPMLQVIVVTPGTTDFDEQRRVAGNLDIPLNQFGADQIARTTNELADSGIKVVYHGPCQAAVETANAIAQGLGVKSKSVGAFRNLDHGLWQGKLIDEVKSTQPKVYRQWQEQPETVCPPKGEMLDAAQQRVHAALDKLLKKHRSGVIGIVVSEPLASIVRCYLMNGKLEKVWQTEPQCGGWTTIDASQRLTTAAVGRLS